MKAKVFVRIVVWSLLLFCLPAPAQLRISEFMAANTRTLADENNSFEDWIEVQNTSATNVNLFDWSLTDSKGNPGKWRFPATNLPPGGFIVVFASNKDRRTPGARLHTNFKLDAAGEYLALVDPNGTVATEFSPKFPPQVSDVSYGFSPGSTNVDIISAGADVRAFVPSTNNGGDLLNYTWTGDVTNEPFSDGAWRSGVGGVGFTDGSGDVFPADIGLDVQSEMLSNNASVFLRIPFVVNDPTNYSLLTLRLKYNDGFVAWINGVQVANANVALDTLAWNSVATATNPGSVTNVIQIGNAGSVLREGTNILAFQGLNVTNDDPSFLVSAELGATTVPFETGTGLYFIIPTPGAENVSGSTRLGPGITDVGHTPGLPEDNDNITVTARVFQTLNPIGTVMLK
ncbi:MAG TPA: lamin tail domain-containing protein, partial [Candidatus Paceibacterota bacterium]|nr:lamin tail domain-containing protein [Candidatus Paceibacterota bacterium]